MPVWKLLIDPRLVMTLLLRVVVPIVEKLGAPTTCWPITSPVVERKFWMTLLPLARLIVNGGDPAIEKVNGTPVWEAVAVWEMRIVGVNDRTATGLEFVVIVAGFEIRMLLLLLLILVTKVLGWMPAPVTHMPT